MALTPTLQQVADYCSTNPDSISFAYLGTTKTLAQWYAEDDINGDTAVAMILNDQAIGAAKVKRVARASINGNDLVDAIIASDDFAGMQPATLAQLTFALNRGSFGATANAVTGLDKILGPFAAAKGAFAGLKSRPSSIYESFVGDGATIDHSGVFSLRHPA